MALQAMKTHQRRSHKDYEAMLRRRWSEATKQSDEHSQATKTNQYQRVSTCDRSS